MPISEDEYDFRSGDSQSTMSKAELRKTHKPIMEKRRRARINTCLNEIKTLILEAMNKDPSRHSKLEKADILEMAVKHLQNVQRQQLAMAVASDPSVLRKFKSGFNECATEIDRYIGQLDAVDTCMKQRVSSHLQKCIGGIEQVAQFNFPGFNNLPFLSGNSVFSSGTQNNNVDTTSNVGDQNNNPHIQIPQGIQLIPSRLPTGELALLVPNSSNLPYFPTIPNSNQQRPSAFAAVTPSSNSDLMMPKPLSPPLSPEIQPEEDLPRYFENRNPSPKGFRPVQPTHSKPLVYTIEDQQVSQVSSTSRPDKHHFLQPMEVKNMKFPINKTYAAEKDPKRMDSPKKLAEPLCIITNQSERFKQAQTKEDSVNYEENLVPRGVKRKFNELNTSGLLAVASHHQDSLLQPSKVFKSQLASFPSAFAPAETSFGFARPMEFSRSNSGQKKGGDEQQPSGSKDNFESNNDMWRPW